MKLQNRISRFPGRVKITKSDGTVEFCTITMADEATEVGTPLNKQTLEGLKEEILQEVTLLNDDVTCTLDGTTLYITLKS